MHWLGLATACATLCFFTESRAQPLCNAAAAVAPPATREGEKALTAPDVEGWLDGFMPYALRRGGVPGAVVVIVKNGQVLFEKGYGVADVAAGRPFDAGTTLFRVGSVSKLFTWTAVMQLVEAGKLDLDADVNTYLDFRIPPRNGKAVTLRNLMTHTAGFEESFEGIAAEDPDHIPSLGATLKHRIPERVYDPGSTPAYSNYGATLAGYIVQRVAGEPFDDYIARHVFAPLGMGRSTFQQRLPPTLLPDVSKGYLNGGSAPAPFELIVWQPAGGLSTTGDDMARFMIAHLQDGRYGSAQILKPETARMMHSSALTLVPPLNRMELGFWEQDINGRRVIAHSGDTVFFHAQLSLFLDDDVGLFIAMNSPGKGDAANAIRQGLFQSFSDRYLPGPLPDGQVDPPTALAHAKMFAVSYSSSRRWFSSFMAATGLFSQVAVTRNGDGTISISGLDDLSGDPRHYREMRPFVWREIGGRDRLAAVVADGRIVRFASDKESPAMVWDATPAWRSARLVNPAFLGGLLAILLTAASWPALALIRAVYGIKFSLQGGQALAYRLVRVASVIALAAIIGWFWVLTLITKPMGLFFLNKHDTAIRVIELVTVVGFIGGLAVSLFNLLVVHRAIAGWRSRLWGVVMLMAMGALVWTGWVGHLLSFSTDY
jgi:CubicO group peptidase (beta-lactamase class C family)